MELKWDGLGVEWEKIEQGVSERSWLCSQDYYESYRKRQRIRKRMMPHSTQNETWLLSWKYRNNILDFRPWSENPNWRPTLNPGRSSEAIPVQISNCVPRHPPPRNLGPALFLITKPVNQPFHRNCAAVLVVARPCLGVPLVGVRLGQIKVSLHSSLAAVIFDDAAFSTLPASDQA